MSPLLKATLAWILALALPMQVLAAAAMLHCTPVPRPAAATQDHSGHHPAALGSTAGAHDHARHLAGDAADSVAHKCSACAACAAGVALPSPVVSTTPIDPARPVLLAPLLRDASVVLAGLERPPRTRLA